MKQDVHSMTRHPRGSSPPDNVEQIYHAWLQRLPVLPSKPATEKPQADIPDASATPEQEKK